MSDFQVDQNEITRIVGDLNNKHFCVFVGASYVIAYKKPVGGPLNNSSGEYDLIYMKEKDFYLMYKNRYIQTGETQAKEAKPKFSTYAEIWLGSPYRLNFNSVVFKPTSTVYEYEFNIWTGFNVDNSRLESASASECPKFLDFMQEIICNGSEILFNYVLDWCADAVQNPEEKQGVALVLRSEVNGTGKTFFCNLFGRLFGKHYMLASKADHILGRFAGEHLDRNIILGAEEAVFVKNMQAKNELKDMITSDTRNVERKNLSVEVSKPNYTRIIFMGNETHIINADMTDRRFQVIEVSAKKAKNRAYFTGIDKAWQDGEKEAFLKLLQTRDIEGLNLEDSRIINKETLEQRFLSLPDFDKWLNNILNDGGIYYQKENTFGNKTTEFAEFRKELDTDVDSEIFYKDYINFCSKIKTKTVRTKQEISRMIKKIIPKIESMPRHVSDGKKITPWRLPPLYSARDTWEGYYGFKFNWTEADTSRQMEFLASVQSKTA